MIRKSISRLILSCVLLCMLAVFSACGKQSAVEENETYQVLCTTFPAYDWIKQISAECDLLEAVLLDTHGADLHSYQPTAADMVKVAQSELVLYIGGTSDAWIEDAVRNAGTAVRAVSLLELLDDCVMPAEFTEGMEHDHDHEHEHNAAEMDEHVWLSLKNARLCVSRLSALLCEELPNEAEMLQSAADAYMQSLVALDERYTQAVQTAEHSVFVMADRFPFRYLADDYGLTCYAAFPGCSTETDAGFDTVILLAQKVDENALSHIAVTESTDGAVAEAVLSNAKMEKVQIVTLDSLQSVTSARVESGETYISVMEKNLRALQQLLS